MKDCTHCVHAQWRRTAAGRMHPNREGRCGYDYKPKPLPAAFYYIGKVNIYGGIIHRGRDLDDHCVYYTRGEM